MCFERLEIYFIHWKDTYEIRKIGLFINPNIFENV